LDGPWSRADQRLEEVYRAWSDERERTGFLIELDLLRDFGKTGQPRGTGYVIDTVHSGTDGDGGMFIRRCCPHRDHFPATTLTPRRRLLVVWLASSSAWMDSGTVAGTATRIRDRGTVDRSIGRVMPVSEEAVDYVRR